MLTQLNPINTYEQAYNNLKAEFGKKSYTVQVIQSRIPDFDFILACINDILTRDPQPTCIEEAIDDRIFKRLKLFSELLPWFVLTASNLNWTPFLSDYITVVLTYQNYLEETWQYNEIDVMEDLKPIITLSDFGAGYLELFRASNILIQDLRAVQNLSSPAMILSHSYLESLGYYDESKVENQQAGECQ